MLWIVMEENPVTGEILDCVSVYDTEEEAADVCELFNRHNENPEDLAYYIMEVDHGL